VLLVGAGRQGGLEGHRRGFLVQHWGGLLGRQVLRFHVYDNGRNGDGTGTLRKHQPFVMLPGPGGSRHRVGEACALALDLQYVGARHFEGVELANLRPAITRQHIDQQADLLAHPDVGLGLNRGT
jgi:hypothetical protein